MGQTKRCGKTSCGLYATPSNTMGAGNPMPPQAKIKKTEGIGDDFEEQIPGSGDSL